MHLHDAEAKGRMIAAGRMLAGIDQAQLAAASGVSPSTISNVERGRIDARRETLTAIRQALRGTFGITLNLDLTNARISVSTSYESLDE